MLSSQKHVLATLMGSSLRKQKCNWKDKNLSDRKVLGKKAAKKIQTKSSIRSKPIMRKEYETIPVIWKR